MTGCGTGEEDGPAVQHPTCEGDPKRSAALFLLKTCEEYKVMQTALNGIVQDIVGLWQDAMESSG